MAAASLSPPQAPGGRPAPVLTLATLLLLAAAGPGSAETLPAGPAAEPDPPLATPEETPPEETPLVRLEPGWGTLHQTLALPAWVDLELAILAEPMANPVGGLVQQARWIQ